MLENVCKMIIDFKLPNQPVTKLEEKELEDEYNYRGCITM